MFDNSKMKVTHRGEVCFIQFNSFNKHGEIRHAFSTRKGGKSKGYFADMNLSFKVGDEKDTVLENYRILCDAADIDVNDIVLSDQTHTANVRTVGRDDRGKGIWRGSDIKNVDGLITNEPGVALVTHCADCCLLCFYDPKKRVIANSHAGWRGTVGEIGAVTVKKMQSDFGCSPSDIIVGIAPSICKKCYEVDTPVYNEFAKLEYLETDRIFEDKGGGKYQLDLWEANRQILVNCGIKNENIEITDICTACNSDLLHSHRATGGKRGVNGLIIEIKE